MHKINKGLFLGVDIGATKTIFLVARFSGSAKFEILEEYKGATPRNAKEILDLVEAKAKEFIGKYGIFCIGIGFAGPVDFERGAVIMGPNLGTGKIEFKKILEKKLANLPSSKIKKISVTVDNDARCFILAESVFGAAKGCQNAIGVTVGTGLGGGVIINGKIYRGATGSAGEFGHTNIEKEREWEEVSSGLGLVGIYKELFGKKASSFKIMDLAKRGDGEALKAIEALAENLGTGLADIIESFNPEIIVLGGGLAEEDIMIAAAKKYIREKVFLPSLAKTRIEKTKLGPISSALGAAWMAKPKKLIKR